MSRPIWKGNISFGLVNIPVNLYSAENRTVLHFHLLDSHNHARIRYERVNEMTGKEVPWNEIVKAYEFDKGNYVIVDEKELERAAAESFQTIEIEDFIDQESLDSLYFDKPYFLISSKLGGKGYVLLRETLERTHKIGIAKVVIRTRQHIAALLPYKNVLVLNLLRFPQEIRDIKDFDIPKEDIKVSQKEMNMAKLLVENMSSKWNPKKYHDENRELLKSWIEKKIRQGKSVASPATEEKVKVPKGKVIDFMELLKKSIKEKEKKSKVNYSKSHKKKKK